MSAERKIDGPAVHAETRRDGGFFPYDLPAAEWLEFEADGFSEPVTGVVYREGAPVRGIPLGGIGTGFMHLGPDGLLDRNTAFNSFLPSGASVGMASVTRDHVEDCSQPFLGLAVDDKVWVLALKGEGQKAGWGRIVDDRMLAGYLKPESGVSYADELHYWGHYPVADMEFDTTAPVRVGVRAWTPFLLGDAEASNTPGSVFEVRLRNTSQEKQHGSVVFSFPGWSEREAHLGLRGNTEFRGAGTYPRRELDGPLNGVHVTHSEPDHEFGYVLGVVGRKPRRTGGCLGWSESDWARAATALPEAEAPDPGASLAVDFDLEPGQAETLRFVLAWYAPFWRGRPSFVWPYVTGWKPYVHKYHDRFKSAADVAQHLAGEHEQLLRRVLGWQQAMYSTAELPGWLRDSLINILHIIPQTSFWAYSPEPDHWAGREGLFAMNESLLSCPQFCTPCDWIANFPIVFFFPDLARRSVAGLTFRQRENGEIPFSMGGGTVMDDPYYGVQYSTDSQVYVHMVARLWQRVGDAATLREFYPSVKKAVRFLETMDEDGDGIVDVFGASWFYEGFPVKGASAYVGGLWLSTLRLAARMAEEMGDREFVDECRSWIERAGDSMETLWNEESGSYYLCRQPTTGWVSDVILSDQLTGEWAALFHGVEGVFPPQRVDTVQDTVWRINVSGSEVGARSTMYPNRTPYAGGYISGYGTLVPAMLRMYTGDVEAGLDLARRMWHNLTLRKGYTWDQPSHVRSDGEQLVGHDYYHNTILWAVPAAVLDQDLGAFCAPGGLVDRLIQAARE